MKKSFISIFLLILAGALILNSCEKAEKLPYYPEGKDITLTASSTAVAPAIKDSNNLTLTLTWTSPEYPMEASEVKFVVELAAAGNNFKNPLIRIVNGQLDTSFIAKELNSYAVVNQWEFGKPQGMEARVISSYQNNNDQKFSNVVSFTYTPYLVPPEVTPPASKQLFLVGSASAGGWDNPVPVSQKFGMIDSVTYEGTFFLNGGGQYLLLPVNGDWSHKYNVADANLPGLEGGGDFGADLGNANIPGPAESGLYKITVDFQHGKFKVTKAGDYGFLYVPGDYQGWAPATAPALGSFNNDQKFGGFIRVPSGGTYEFKFTLGPNWDNSLGDDGPGKLSPGGGNLKFPGDGYFYLTVNTNDNTWSLTRINSFGVIGSFAGSGWSTDIPMTYDEDSKRWEATITTADGDQFKFRANGDWAINFGDDGTGRLVPDGPNIGDVNQNFAVPAGTHKIWIYLESAGYYTYTIQ